MLTCSSMSVVPIYKQGNREKNTYFCFVLFSEYNLLFLQVLPYTLALIHHLLYWRSPLGLCSIPRQSPIYAWKRSSHQSIHIDSCVILVLKVLRHILLSPVQTFFQKDISFISLYHWNIPIPVLVFSARKCGKKLSFYKGWISNKDTSSSNK